MYGHFNPVIPQYFNKAETLNNALLQRPRPISKVQMSEARYLHSKAALAKYYYPQLENHQHQHTSTDPVDSILQFSGNFSQIPAESVQSSLDRASISSSSKSSPNCAQANVNILAPSTSRSVGSSPDSVTKSPSSSPSAEMLHEDSINCNSSRESNHLLMNQKFVNCMILHV